MFAWISIRPQQRWNIRSENGPCTRVTWLWYSSIGLIARLPYSSSWAYGPNTLVNSTLARVPKGCGIAMRRMEKSSSLAACLGFMTGVLP